MSKVTSFIFIIAKMKSSQHGLKGQRVLVPKGLKKVQIILTWSCDKEHLISLALKFRLTDKSVYNKQQISPALVNRAFENVTVDINWKALSEQSRPRVMDLPTSQECQRVLQQ